MKKVLLSSFWIIFYFITSDAGIATNRSGGV